MSAVLKHIPVADILYESDRPAGGEGDIDSLAHSIESVGLINPVRVAAGKTAGNFTLIAGRRRVAAYRKMGWDVIPAIVEGVTDPDVIAEISMAENVNRLEMHPLDEAVLFKKVLERGEQIEALAKRCDRTVSAIWQRVQLLSLSGDIKTLFRNGNISLAAAAMLTSLDGEGQAAFYGKFKDSYEVKRGDEIANWEVQGFLNGIQHDLLYGFLAGRECAACKTRTFFTDKGLFPELDAANDSCLNHECYLKKWTKLLAGRIKSLKGEHPDTALIAAETSTWSRFTKIFGPSVTAGGTEYGIKKMDWDNRADGAGKNALPCFIVDMTDKLEIKPGFWKERKKQAADKKESAFAPAVKMLELPEEEAREVVAALEGNRKNMEFYQFNSRVREKIFFRLIGYRAAKQDDGKEKELFIKNILDDRYIRLQEAQIKKVLCAFAGSADPAALNGVAVERIFAAANAVRFGVYGVPDPEDFPKPGGFITWTGIPKDGLKKMYQEEIRALIPKPKAAGKKKTAGREGE